MDNTDINEETIKDAIARAREAAAMAEAKGPRADSAYYDWDSGKITINFQHGASFSFPPEIAQGLTDASPEELAEVEVTPSGALLHWEKLDADLSIPLAGIYGNKAWMAQMKNKWETPVSA